MNRFQYMSLGLLLVFIGTQLYFVETYELTPRVSKLMKQKKEFDGDDVYNAAANNYQNAGDYYSGNNNYYNAGYNDSLAGPVGPTKKITPPNWICWPVFFLGAVFFLHALALPSSGFHRSSD